MNTKFEVDINCPFCFDDIVEALREDPHVHEVDANMSVGCVSVDHDTDASRLASLIADHGHRIVVAGNGEIVQDSLHPQSRAVCRHHA